MKKFDDQGPTIDGELKGIPAPERNQILIIKANDTRWAGLFIDELNFDDTETLPRVAEELDELLRTES